jgi:NitT/TauT family transport system substrate-binding protein
VNAGIGVGALLVVGLLRAVSCSPTAPVRVTLATSTPAPTPPSATASYTPRPLSPPVHVRVIDSQVTSQLPVYLAYDRGYFKDEGLDVDLVTLSETPAAVQAVATNQVQFALALPDPVVFNALNRGVKLKILAASTINTPTDRRAQFLVRRDLLDSGTYRSAADLRGLTVAVPAVSYEWYLDKMLADAGLTFDQVNAVLIRTSDMISAFQTRVVDAAWVTEPTASAINQQRIANTIGTAGPLYPGAVGAALLMSPQFGAEQPEAAQRFVIAFLRGARDYAAGQAPDSPGRAAMLQSLARHANIRNPSLYEQIGLPGVDPNGEVNPAPSWSVFQEFYLRRGIQDTRIDLSEYVDFSLVENALVVLGREPTDTGRGP